jgi:hypothetical protein
MELLYFYAFHFLGLLSSLFENSLNVIDLLAKYSGMDMMIICMNLDTAVGMFKTSIKKYTILVDNAVPIRDIVI